MQNSKQKYSSDYHNKALIYKEKTNTRRQNPLEELSINFIEFYNDSENKIFTIKDIMRKLKIQKRRIYDLTNVFEGKFNLVFMKILLNPIKSY